MTFPKQSDEPTGEPTAPVPGQEPAPAVTTPQYVTEQVLKAELETFGKSVKDELSTLFRGIQSQNDKLQDRVSKKIAAFEQAAQAQGITLTPTQHQRLVDDTTLAELQSTYQSGTQAPSPDQAKVPSVPDPEVEKVNIAADTLIRLSGVTFDDGDPEGAMIDKAAEGTAAEYLSAIQEAIRLKKERLASGGQATPQRTPAGGVPGAIPGSPNTNPISNIMDKDQLWDLAKKKGEV